MSYVHTFEAAEEFDPILEAEYLRRHGDHIRQVIVIGDGAKWIWNQADRLYPAATQIVDLYHAREHLTDLADHLAFITGDRDSWLAERRDELDAGDIDAILTAARTYPLTGIKAAELDTKLGYFETNAHRMRYARFRSLGLFVGSGAVEAACKSVIAQRVKHAGMRWNVHGANAIITLRCAHAAQPCDGRWDQLWPSTDSDHSGLTQGPRAI
ncbi:UPF0236 family protein [Acrocarpospora sp. B8E8]|uniref:UPF0236 family transposase-like protein n=1 Tax=Acrocarpospora sp. B8E8 TaxID=3153572 RepID=UPI00325DBFA2